MNNETVIPTDSASRAENVLSHLESEVKFFGMDIAESHGVRLERRQSGGDIWIETVVGGARFYGVDRVRAIPEIIAHLKPL